MDPAGSGVFEARLGGIVRWITIGTCLLLLAVMAAGILKAGNDFLLVWAMYVVPVGMLVFGTAFRTTGYALEGNGVYVLRPVGRKRIATRGAEALADDDAFRGAWRLFGNGGFFGVTGWFRTRKYGTCRAWVTDLSSLVVLRSDGRTALVSPLDRERFVQALGGTRPLSPGPSPARGEGRKAAPR
ncbi:MAG: PH domain-containing protein [Xanthomonadales bacterium]|nr:PH domain-containing protein [Xanthomonadales bacterium]